MRWLLALSLCLAGTAQAACTVLSGGQPELAEGPEKGATVVIVGERIAAVGKGLEGLRLSMANGEVLGASFEGRACDFVQVGGRRITPGFVAVSTQLGLVEVSMESSTRNHDGGGDSVRAALRVADAYNPRSSLVPVQRAGGLTGAVAAPTGGRISGQAAFVRLTGQTQADAVVSASAAMYASMGGSSRAAGLAELRELLEDARTFRANRAAWEQNRSRAFASGAGRLDLDALGPVLDGTLPLVVGADRAADIEALLRFRAELDLRLVISGGAEAWRHAAALAEAQVAVIVDPYVLGAGSFDQLHARADNAAILARAGVPVILSPGWTHNTRALPQIAGNAVRGGMDPVAAIRAVTRTPVEVFGGGERGRIEAGALADLVVWSGDPLELSSRVERIYIGGVEQDLSTRQTELLEAYRTLPGTPVPPLPLPD